MTLATHLKMLAKAFRVVVISLITLAVIVSLGLFFMGNTIHHYELRMESIIKEQTANQN